MSTDRLLHRIPANAASLREESLQFVRKNKGILVPDDSAPDRPYAHKTELVRRHWTGKHHRVVSGISLVSLLWSDGDAHIPCDFGICYKNDDGRTKNDHFTDMLSEAKITGFEPEYVLSDSWYASLKNPRIINSYNWFWLTRSEANRLINPDNTGNIPLSSANISENGSIVRLRGYGFVKIFGIVDKKGNTEYRATNNLDMDESERIRFSDFSWTIGEYHRGPKQFCGVERCQCRKAKARRNHIVLAIRTFLRFGIFTLKSGNSWSEAKTRIIRDAVRAYLSNPVYAF